jgi:hypothetical protein
VLSVPLLTFLQAKKFANLADDDDDSIPDEDSLLESPLDKVEPYGMFRDALLKLQQEQPPLYESLTKILEPADQQVLQGVIQEAEARSIPQAQHVA